MDLLQKNMTIIQNRWPASFDIISAAKTPEEVFLETNGRQPTLVIDGIHLSSIYDRSREAQLQASLVPEESTEAWVYGLGIGDLPRVMLLRNQTKKLHVVIMNPAVAKQSFIFFDHSDWLEDPRVDLTAAHGETDDLHLPFAAVAPCLQLADERSSRLRDLIVLELSTPFIRKRHNAANKDLLKRIEENTKFALSDGDVAGLFNSRKGHSIAVAAAGPTLSEHYAWLRQKRPQFTLIAVDAALKALTDEKIYPDIVLTIDMSLEGVIRFFRGIFLEPFAHIPLVYFPAVHSDVLNLWPGPRLTAYPESDIYRTLFSTCPKGRLFSSGSVLHPAVDLAVQMGAERIFLLGADFSFPGGLSHVKGSPASQRSSDRRLWVLDGEGQRVWTRPDYRGYLRDLERYIAGHSKIQFFNGSQKGAHIKGAPYRKELL